MSSQLAFNVEYEIEDAEWRKATEQRFEADVYPTVDLFYGRLQFRAHAL